MAVHNILPILIILFCKTTTAADADGAFEDAVSCKDSCSKTFAAHTYEISSQTESCRKGCQFYTIMDFIYNHLDQNATMTDCISSCEESYYNSTEDSNACKMGCQGQPEAEKRKNADDEMTQDEPSIHLNPLYPMMYLHSLYSNMIDKVYRQAAVTWYFFMDTESGKLVVMRSEPHIVIHGEIEDTPDGLRWSDDKTSGYVETNIVGQDNSATPLLNDRPSQMRASQLYNDGIQLDIDDGGKSDWLSCVARKTGVARVVLAFLILACAVVMIWFCLSAINTAPEQRLSIKGDLEYLRSMVEKDGFKLLRPQASVEARPLPVKIRVEQI